MGEFSRVHQTDLTDRELMDFWQLVQASGRDRAWAIDVAPLSPAEFVGKIRQPGRHSWLVAWRGVRCGLISLDLVPGSKSAIAHFLCLPCGTRRTETKGVSVLRGMGLYALGQALWERNQTGFRLDVINGFTPACNVKALKYARMLGGQVVGIVPGMFWVYDEHCNTDGIITTFNRESVPEWCAKI